MAVKKSKELSFTLKDAAGALRVVHVQISHDQEGARDKVQIIATSDGVPLDVQGRVGRPTPRVKTRSRL